jgi:integral membrane protein
MKWLARVEGASYLLLLFVAMPLKYAFEAPWLVHQLGRVHGVLVLALWIAIVRRRELTWATRWTGLITSMIPLGFVFFEAAVSKDRLRT